MVAVIRSIVYIDELCVFSQVIIILKNKNVIAIALFGQIPGYWRKDITKLMKGGTWPGWSTTISSTE